jgi:isoleucyl-tRNA synthetase
VRREVNEKLELARAEKHIGAPLTAHVSLTVGDEATYDILKAQETELPMIFIVSGVTLQRSHGEATAVEIVITRAGGEKCPRCWRYVPALKSVTFETRVAVNSEAEADERVCPRCVDCVEATRAS